MPSIRNVARSAGPNAAGPGGAIWSRHSRLVTTIS